MTTTQGNTDSTTTEAPRLRASDLDRTATVRVLQDAVARGLLAPDEGSDRMATAFAAVHLAELPPLTADLSAGASSRQAPGWRPLATMALEQVRASLHRPATGRVTPARVAVALLVALLVVLLLGSLVGGLFLDGGPGGGGPGRDGFDRG